MSVATRTGRRPTFVAEAPDQECAKLPEEEAHSHGEKGQKRAESGTGRP